MRRLVAEPGPFHKTPLGSPEWTILLTQIIGLLIIAVLVALAARRLQLPYTIGLVVIGIVLALTQSALHMPLTREFVFEFILPPLLFEAAINIHWHELKRDLAIVLSLAVFGTVIAACIITAGLVAVWMAPEIGGYVRHSHRRHRPGGGNRHVQG